MTGPKTNEREGTRAVLRGYHMSASKARPVLNLIRGEDVTTAREILGGTSREAADVVGKVLASAIANAVNNDGMAADELYVSAAFADEGVTMKRFSPRARGRAGRIRKRSCHITVIVSRLDDARLALVRSARDAHAAASRSRRVASSRRRADQQASLNKRAATAAAKEADETTDETMDETTDETMDMTETEAEDALDEAAESESGDDAAVEATDDAESDETASSDVTEETDK